MSVLIRLIFRIGKIILALSFLKSCSWLPVNLRIHFRYTILVNDAPSFPAPQYISDFRVSYDQVRLLKWSGTAPPQKKKRKEKQRQSALKLMKLFKAVCF